MRVKDLSRFVNPNILCFSVLVLHLLIKLCELNSNLSACPATKRKAKYIIGFCRYCLREFPHGICGIAFATDWSLDWELSVVTAGNKYSQSRFIVIRLEQSLLLYYQGIYLLNLAKYYTWRYHHRDPHERLITRVLHTHTPLHGYSDFVLLLHAFLPIYDLQLTKDRSLMHFP